MLKTWREVSIDGCNLPRKALVLYIIVFLLLCIYYYTYTVHNLNIHQVNVIYFQRGRLQFRMKNFEQWKSQGRALHMKSRGIHLFVENKN